MYFILSMIILSYYSDIDELECYCKKTPQTEAAGLEQDAAVNVTIPATELQELVARLKLAEAGLQQANEDMAHMR